MSFFQPTTNRSLGGNNGGSGRGNYSVEEDEQLLVDEVFNIEESDAYPLSDHAGHTSTNSNIKKSTMNGHQQQGPYPPRVDTNDGSHITHSRSTVNSPSSYLQLNSATLDNNVNQQTPHNYLRQQPTSTTSLIEASVALLTTPLGVSDEDLVEIAHSGRRRKSIIPPETDFLFNIMHCTTLEDAQELCRNRYEFLQENDDAARLHRYVCPD